MLDVGRHPNIELLAYSEIEEVSGSAGCFTARVRKKARYVDAAKCTGCGACAEVCPTAVTDLYNEGHSTRKAVYSWFAQGIPSTHAIDADHCRVFNGKKCGVCAKKCEAGAIDFEQKDEVVELEVGAVIAANGYTIFDPVKIPEYRYRDLPNVITAMEFERFLSASGPTHGHLDRPSDVALNLEVAGLEKQEKRAAKMLARLEDKNGEKSEVVAAKYAGGEVAEEHKDWMAKYEDYKVLIEKISGLKEKAESFTTAKRLAFIQCVGSRDLRFFPFCSGYCCMHSIKEAIIAHEHDNETESIIFGMDIRAVGKGFDEYRVRGGNNSNITYKRSRVAEITGGPNNNPVLVYEDTQLQKVVREEFDLVILATACGPSEGVEELGKILGIEINQFGFFKTTPENPVDTTREGIFVCGCGHSPMDIPESVAQASSAAARAVQTVTHEKLLQVS
ncbi:MAG: 4Fe-4S binding protein [Desulforhopalus sp.]